MTINGGSTSQQTIAGKEIILNTGVLAKQANGAVIAQCGDLVILATVAMSKKPKEGVNFFPLTIEFAEKMYASGKIPGGFFKREARPSTTATLTARLIDRPLRPTFPKNFFNDVQVIITILSYDPTICIETLSIVAASAAITVSDIPFNGPVGAAKIGRIDGNFVINPSEDELKNSDLDLVVSGTKDAILMIEAGANQVSEETILEGIMIAHESIKETVQLQEALQKQAGKEKLAAPTEDPQIATMKETISDFIGTKIQEALTQGQNNKSDVDTILATIEKEVTTTFIKEDENNESIVKTAFEKIRKEQVRQSILKSKVRPDGRKLDEIRPIDIQLNVLPSVHGSAVFTRGETQSLGVITLGSPDDSQMIDGLNEKTFKSYFFHYNFPPFSVGECGRLMTGRRELGHGALAERALLPILPSVEAFPYTLRIVSEILESNGSSSMASVCSGSLSMMSGGVPIKAAVSGIAMGLLMDDTDCTILSDIQGLEDHYGDMDFKVAGTTEGITALQLDIKIAGLSKEILKKALTQAKEGRLFILNKMNQAITQPNQELSPKAPKIVTIYIDPEKVGLIIGPGGKNIRKIEEDSGATVIVTDGTKGEVNITAKNKEALDMAKGIIEGMTKEPKIGDNYTGKVVKVVSFGAFVEFAPGKEGLVHISKIAPHRVEKVEDYINVGDQVKVKIENIDQQKRVNLVINHE